MESGASGYVLKDSPAPHLLNAIREIHRGGSFLSPRMLSQLVDDFRSRVKSTQRLPRFATLTQREKEVLKMLAEGQFGQGNRLHPEPQRENHRSA